LSGLSGRLTVSVAWEESLLIRRNGTPSLLRVQVRGRLIAAQGGGRERINAFPRRDFACLRVAPASAEARGPCERDFSKLNLHLSIFEQHDKNDQQRANGLRAGGRE